MWSYWEQQSFIGKPDFTVIGSGIVGLAAAIELKTRHPNSSVLILEAGHLPSGASTKNAGFACFGSPSEILMDLNHSEEQSVFALLQKRFEGLEYLRKMLGDLNIDYQNPGSYELFRNKSEFERVNDQLEYLNKKTKEVIGFKAYSSKSSILHQAGFDGFQGAIEINGEGQLDTGLMMKTLINKAQSLDISIINGLGVDKLIEESNHVVVETREGKFRSSKVLIATNGFAKQFLPEIDLLPGRAQVLITAPIRNLKFKGTFHFDQGYFYFRNVGNQVLLGGGRNMNPLGEATSVIERNEYILNHLEKLLKTQILPNNNFEIAHSWAGIMGLGREKQPIVQKVKPNTYCAVRLGGMGVAIGSLIGKEATELILADQI